MSKFNFPKLVREVPLSEYAPELKEKIYVWINPTGKVLSDLSDTFTAYMADREQVEPFLTVVSEILSQGEEATRWTVENLRELLEGTKDTDPAFWMWFNNRILSEIKDHRFGLKKKLETETAILAVGGKTQDWYLAQILELKQLREHIRNATGLEVGLGELDEIPPDWLDAILAVEVDAPRKRRMIEQVKQGITTNG